MTPLLLPIQPTQHSSIDLCIGRSTRVHDVTKRHGIPSAAFTRTCSRWRSPGQRWKTCLLLWGLEIRMGGCGGAGRIIRCCLRSSGRSYGRQTKVIFCSCATTDTPFRSSIGWLSWNWWWQNRWMGILLRTLSRAFTRLRR